jgi:hypothetical protein
MQKSHDFQPNFEGQAVKIGFDGKNNSCRGP